PPVVAGGLHERRPVAGGAGVAVHEHHGLPRVRRTGFDQRRADAADLHTAVPQLAHRAGPPEAGVGTAAAGDCARPRPRTRLRRCALSASGAPLASIRTGPMLRVPNASITADTRSSKVAAENSMRSPGLSFRP